MRDPNRNAAVNRSVMHEGSRLDSRDGNNSLPRDAVMAMGPGEVQTTKNKESREMRDHLLKFGKKGNRPSAINLPTHNFQISEVHVNVTGRNDRSNDSRGYSEYDVF